MKIKNKLVLFLVAVTILSFPNLSFASGKAYPSNQTETAQPIAGVNSSGDQVVLKLGSDGSIISSSQDTTNGSVTVTSSAATFRTQAPSTSVTGCTFIAHPLNAGTIYVGGSTVTNSTGSNIGVPLSAGSALSDFITTNLNKVYFSASNAGDTVIFICN